MVAPQMEEVEKLVPAQLWHAPPLQLPKFKLQLVAQALAQRWIIFAQHIGAQPY